MRKHFFLCALGVAAFSASVLADTRIEYKTTEGVGDMSSITIAQGKLRMDADKDTSVILDPAAGVMLILDHSKKTVQKMTKADIDGMMKQLADMMANIPPEMRDMMASRMGGAGRGGGTVTFEPTGESATVAGKSCKVYRTTVGGKAVAESCLADASVIDIPAADRATLQAAMAWSKEMSDAMAKTPLGSLGNSIPFRGGLFPVRSTKLSGDKRDTSEFTGVSTAPVSPAVFAAPADYKAQELPGLGRGRGRGGAPTSSSIPRTRK